MNDDVKKKISLIDELMIEDINNLSISELEENISALKMIINKYSKKIEEKKLSQDKAEIFSSSSLIERLLISSIINSSIKDIFFLTSSFIIIPH